MKRPVHLAAAAITAFGLLGASQSIAATKIDFILNWIAGGDHAPYYYAEKMGWYKEAGPDHPPGPGWATS